MTDEQNGFERPATVGTVAAERLRQDCAAAQ